jgi:hypothetical protein
VTDRGARATLPAGGVDGARRGRGGRNTRRAREFQGKCLGCVWPGEAWVVVGDLDAKAVAAPHGGAHGSTARHDVADFNSL